MVGSSRLCGKGEYGPSGVVMMNKYAKMVLYGFILWLVPFITGFLFVDISGNFLIPETFFKSIMIVEGNLIGVILAVRYFREPIAKDQLLGA